MDRHPDEHLEPSLTIYNIAQVRKSSGLRFLALQQFHMPEQFIIGELDGVAFVGWLDWTLELMISLAIARNRKRERRPATVVGCAERRFPLPYPSKAARNRSRRPHH